MIVALLASYLSRELAHKTYARAVGDVGDVQSRKKDRADPPPALLRLTTADRVPLRR